MMKSQLVRVADLPGQRSLRSAQTSRLLVPPLKLFTVGDREGPAADGKRTHHL